MASIPRNEIDIIEQFGPHRAYSSGERLETNSEPDKIVKTHCCF